MNLSQEERDAVVEYRIKKAWETLRETKGNFEFGFWNTTANRMYYACYYMVSALLIKYGLNTQTHSGVIRLLGLHFVSTGILTKQEGRIYSQIYELRQSGDYDDWREVAEEDVDSLILPAEQLMIKVENLIRSKVD